ncbi:MAG TPA: phosphotransferase [Woeseiaceae bacterium]|nr:phosphotransferase [Woeseiaceae bacterium]
MTRLASEIEILTEKHLGMTAARVLLYNNYDLTEGSILLFLFDTASSSPFAVLKLSRNRPVLAREYENLQCVHKVCPGLAAAPLFFDQTREFFVLCTAPIAANRLSSYRAKSRKLKLVTRQLAELHTTLRSQSGAATIKSDDYLKPFSGLYDTPLPASVADYYNELAAKHAQSLLQFPLPEISQHGDLYFDNILARGQRIYFLDWEDFGDIKLPGYDLFSLVFDVCNLENGETRLLRRSIDFIAANTVGYFRQLEIPADIVDAIMSYTLVQQYHRSWTLGRTSQEAFATRLVAVAENEQLFKLIARAYRAKR